MRKPRQIKLIAHAASCNILAVIVVDNYFVSFFVFVRCFCYLFLCSPIPEALKQRRLTPYEQCIQKKDHLIMFVDPSDCDVVLRFDQAEIPPPVKWHSNTQITTAA